MCACLPLTSDAYVCLFAHLCGCVRAATVPAPYNKAAVGGMLVACTTLQSMLDVAALHAAVTCSLARSALAETLHHRSRSRSAIAVFKHFAWSLLQLVQLSNLKTNNVRVGR